MSRDVVNRPVHELSGLTTTEGAGYVATGEGFDFALGGLAFNSASSGEVPYIRRTAPQRKEQFDNAAEPGEQSLSYWWLRSQASFHGGAGQEFLDGQSQEDIRRIMFKDSLGVDVWTAGRVQMLNTAPQEKAVTAISGLIPAGTDTLIYAQGVGVYLHNISTDTTTTLHTAATDVAALCSDGENYYFSVTAGIYKGPLDNGVPPAQIYTAGVDALAFVKARLMAAVGDELFELDTAATAAALPAAFYTSPVGQSFEHFAEGPAGIYVAARLGSKSQILRIGIDGTPPVLAAPVQVAELPDGETISSLYGYLGAFLGIGTNRGLRVGLLSESGGISYGPYVFSTENAAGDGFDVGGMVGFDRFLYVGVREMNLSDGSDEIGPGLIRVDLSQEVAPGQFAYAKDLQSKVIDVASTLTGVTTVGGRLVFAVVNNTATGGVYVQDRTAYETSGYLLTSKIRFSTSENKVIRYLRITADSGSASLQASTVDPQRRELSAVVLDTGTDTVVERVTRIRPSEYVSVRVVFTNSDSTSTPKFRSWQIKALPSQKRQREFIVPVYIYDREKTRTGLTIGYEGFALQRLEALEALEETSETVTFQHLNGRAADATGRSVIIDSVEFRQVTPPKSMSGWGGIAVITLKSVS